MKNVLVAMCLLWLVPGLADEDRTDQLGAIGAVLDGFHQAAASGDAQSYLGRMTKEAVFQGTDEWERWPKEPEFRAYVGSRFKDGTGWDYRPVARNITIAPSGQVAWFDEVTYSETNGRFRGTGVLMLEASGWKVAHYAMSFLILNENWEEVIKITQETRHRLEAATASSANADEPGQ